jgi:hypothetical protein
MKWYIAGRSGARPRPPAAITTSCPRNASTGHAVPNGPRTPIVSPGVSRAIARVTFPTVRIVWRTAAGTAGSELTEIATSPTPGKYSMLNWPGRKAKSPSARSKVATPGVSGVTARTAAIVTCHGDGGSVVTTGPFPSQRPLR